MGKTEKRLNKWLIGAIIGTTLIGAGGLSMTPKGQSFWSRMIRKCKRRGRSLAHMSTTKKKKKIEDGLDE